MRTVWNVLLALGSLVVGLSLCEAALRVLHPRYDYAARPPQRIHHWSSEYPHPDTGAKHRVAYNNLGSRQHRDFNERDLAEGVNLAFFGDSYTENLRMPAHHSFTEVLDYLLSDSTAEGSFMRGARGAHLPRAPNFNVLNFGITGTGPVEQYSRWASLAVKVKPRLRHVFYVHMTNDIANVRYAMRHAARRSGGAARVSAGIRALSRLHLTYLALDVWRRLDDGAAQRLSPMSESEALAAFESVLRRWRREVEAAGGEFHIVLLPTPDGDRWFRRLESPSSWNVLDLPGCFNEAIPNYDYADWRFAKATHWNEAANMVAARCLYRDLEELLDLPERSDAQLAQALQGYYAAFQDPDRFGGEAGWMPPPSPVGMAVPLADSEADRIVARYQALDQDGDTYRRRVVDAVRSSEPVLRSVWNVHLSAEHRLVVYVRSPQGEREGRAPRKEEPSAGEREGRAPRKKEPCDAEQDPSRGMFLQVRPFNVAWLRPRDQARGHYAVDLRARSWLPLNGFESAACVLAVPLPRWLAVSARTGQQAADGELLWEGEFPVDDVEEWNRMRAHYRREYRAIAETEPVARSVWDVHALRERREIAFLKAPCALADLLAGYFVLRTFPARNVQGGVYTETSFSFQTHTRRRRFSAHIGPTMFDDSCLLIAPLPDGRVGAVKVGEYAHDTRALIWQATFYWDTDSLRRAHAAVSGRRPDAAGAFEVYRREDALVYVREPCAEADTRQRFFLHAYAARADDRDARRVNLDFDFVHRGALFDGKCVALAPLPEAVPGGGPVVRLRTGQFASAGETWAVELPEA